MVCWTIPRNDLTVALPTLHVNTTTASAAQLGQLVEAEPQTAA